MNLVACVTGADRGLGFECTKALLVEGYTVFAGKYNPHFHYLENLKVLYPSTLHIVSLDVSTDQGVKDAVSVIASLTNHVDVLINNSAITGDNHSTIKDPLNTDEILKVFNVNAVGALRMVNQLYSLLMAGTKKLIINISSEAGSIGDCSRKGWFAYCASKAAMNMFSALIHNQIIEDGGQIYSLHPGWMKTWLGERYKDDGPLTPDIPASHIVQMIQRGFPTSQIGLPYIDYLGNPLRF
jgi:NAD(P)-dependent dehydrogenase (short-subunit alcohol dehydrogenase family)